MCAQMMTCPNCGANLTSRGGVQGCVACLLKAGLPGSRPRPAFPEEADSTTPSARPGAAAAPAIPEAALQASDHLSPVLGYQAGDRIGPYRLVQQLGEGGFGTVFLAEQEHPLRRRVALKVIKPGMGTKEVLTRFQAERQALALMDHPAIAKVHDAGATHTGLPYFVMELVDGVPITRFCDARRFSTPERLDLFIQVCQGVQHAHQKGVIHRDLKPSNILVVELDGMPAPKIIDFGLAKALTEGSLTEHTFVTQIQQFLGTPAYMSPEQARLVERDIDTRSDVYSLGVLLYELLTGRTPFDGQALAEGGLDEMRRLIREQDPPPPSTRLSILDHEELSAVAQLRHSEPPRLVGLIRGDLDWITMKALEKDRARRYETASGLALDLQRHLHHEPILARPATAWERTWKWARRRPAVAAVVSVIAAAAILCAGLAVYAWKQALLATANRDRAEQGERNARRSLYIANLNLSQLTWEQGNIGRLQQLVRETGTYPERGFEWFFMQRQIHLDLRTFQGIASSVLSVQFSPSGRQLLTASEDRSAVLWDIQSGRELVQLKGHLAPISGAVFSPDGTSIATASWDGTAKVWEASSGALRSTLSGHSGRVWSVVYSPNCERIATSSWDSTIRIWDSRTGQFLTKLSGHLAPVYSLAFTPDSLRLVSCSDDRTAKVWDPSTGELLLTFAKHGSVVHAVAVSPDGRWIATGSGDQSARIWDSTNGVERLTLRGHRAVTSVVFSPDGHWLLTANEDQTAQIWDATDGKEGDTFRGHSAPLSSVAFASDGRCIATASEDRTAKVWAFPLPPEPLVLRGHERTTLSAAFCPDGRRIVTGSVDRTARVWDAWSGAQLLVFTNHLGAVASVAVSPDGSFAASAAGDHLIKIWSIATGQELQTLSGHLLPVDAVAWSPDGAWLVSGSSDQTLKTWDARSGQEQQGFTGHKQPVRCVAWSPDGRHLASGSDDQTAKLWRRDADAALRTLPGHEGPVQSVTFSTDGQLLATGSDDRSIRLWDTSNGHLLMVLHGHTAGVRSVAFAADGRRLLSAGMDGETKLWELETGRELLTLRARRNPAFAAAFSPDGQRILTSLWDGTALVWSSATPEQVAQWEEEERQAALRLGEALRRTHPSGQQEQPAEKQDPGAISSWLILGPIPLPKGQIGPVALDASQVPAEGQLQPRSGDRVVVEGRSFAWKAVELPDYRLDFQELFERGAPQSVAYAVAYVEAERAQAGIRAMIGSDDQSKLYLNGQQVYQCREPRTFTPDREAAEGLRLRPGVNRLVFKVVNGFQDWKGSVHLTQADGTAITGIRVTTNPAAR